MSVAIEKGKGEDRNPDISIVIILLASRKNTERYLLSDLVAFNLYEMHDLYFHAKDIL